MPVPASNNNQSSNNNASSSQQSSPSFMDNIMNVFHKKPQTQQQPNITIQQATQPQLDKDGKPVVETPKDPLEVFGKLWQNDASGDKNKPPEFKIDPEIIKKATEQLDYSSAVPKDIMERIQKGDSTAISELANSLGRQQYSQMLEHFTALTDRFVNARSEHDRKGLDHAVNSRLSKNSLKSIAENSPVAQEHLSKIAEDLYKQHPDATPEWIESETKNYFVQMAQLIDPTLSSNKSADGKDQNSPKAQKATDWDNFFGTRKSQ